jgi:hypothetical protein
MSFSSKAFRYFSNLNSPKREVNQIKFINPYSSPEVKVILKKYFNKYYCDNNKRIFIIGINPGRFGGGLTGISFTDPVALRESCGIENNLGFKKELSSKFFYLLIDKYGGPQKFFAKFFLTALYPFALIKNGKNYNYYDDKYLSEYLKDEIVKNIKAQISFGAERDFAILLGKKNASYFKALNDKHKFFRKIFIVEHPRYIMQYKSKSVDIYIKKYIDIINS